MQERNNSKSPIPKPKDGTQVQKKDVTDANWYGASKEPQEEFIENDPTPNSVNDAREATGPTSEGTPSPMRGTKDVEV